MELSRIVSVKWKDINIGYLVKDEAGFLFKYDGNGMSDARKQGYSYLVGFKNLKQVYQSEQLFPVFKSRVPSRQRRDIDRILEKLNLKEYDEFEILIAKRGKTNTDAISVEEEVDKEKIRKIREILSEKKKNRSISKMVPKARLGENKCYEERL